ncbi:MAG TPA: glycosyltransferase family 4 protein [Acidimicrobiales bacterium]|nr:glycosyltransferase family 4 protein [Acidimicrobiales bacterium]
MAEHNQNRRARILLVDRQDETIGGAQFVLDQILRSVDRDRFSLSFVCLRDGPWPQSLRETGMKVDVVPLSRMRDLRSLSSVLRNLSRIFRRDEIDLVHANQAPTGLLTGLASPRRGPAQVWHVYDPFTPRTAKQKAVAMGFRAVRPDGIVYGTRPAADHFRSWFPSVSSTVVLPGIDVERCRQGDGMRARQKLGIPSEDLVVSTFGRVHPIKRQVSFLRCIAGVSESSTRRVHGVICGAKGPEGYWRSVERLRSELGLGDSVHMTDFVPDQMKDDLVAASDVVLHLALFEPFGMAVLEAMAAGKAVVAADAYGPSSYVSNGENGILVPDGDVERATAAVSRLLADPTERSILGKRASKTAEGHSLGAMVGAIEDFWDQVLESRLSTKH